MRFTGCIFVTTEAETPEDAAANLWALEAQINETMKGYSAQMGDEIEGEDENLYDDNGFFVTRLVED
jgi:hypothetical protein